MVDAYKRANGNCWITPDASIPGPVEVALDDPEFLSIIGPGWKRNSKDIKCVKGRLDTFCVKELGLDNCQKPL